MRKQIVVALALTMGLFSFAQKKELKSAEKAIKNKNYAEAKTALTQAETLMSSMDEKSKAKFNYLKGQAMYAGGQGSLSDIDSAIEYFNSDNGSYKSEISLIRQEITNTLLQKANKGYETKDYAGASSNFERVYGLNKKDTVYLYYAAATAVSVPDYDKALELYNELKGLGYTGITTQYYATDKTLSLIHI